nr:MAK10-like protein [Tanacetum cinerariifolium]
MGDENPIHTLEDYSRTSHEGYRNTIKLPEGNNVVPLRFDTIRLMQNGCSFHRLRFEDPNQHLKDFLKLVDSLDLDGENKERTRLRKLPSLDGSEPQPLLNNPSSDINLREERGLQPTIKPPSPDSFRMKEVDHLTNHTPPLPRVTSFHLRELYCYYRPCVDDPKKHYGFKPSLLGQSGSLGVDFLIMKMREDDWELEPIEISFLGRRLNFPVRPKEVENVRINETHQLDHIIQQPIF